MIHERKMSNVEEKYPIPVTANSWASQEVKSLAICKLEI